MSIDNMSVVDFAMAVGVSPNQTDYKANNIDYIRFKVQEAGYKYFGFEKGQDGLFASLVYSRTSMDKFFRLWDNKKSEIESTIWARYIHPGEKLLLKEKGNELNSYTVINKAYVDDHNGYLNCIDSNGIKTKRIDFDKIVYWKFPHEPYDAGQRLNRWASYYIEWLKNSSKVNELLSDIGIKKIKSHVKDNDQKKGSSRDKNKGISF